MRRGEIIAASQIRGGGKQVPNRGVGGVVEVQRGAEGYEELVKMVISECYLVSF